MTPRAAELVATAAEAAADELIAGRIAEQRHQLQDPAVPSAGTRPTTQAATTSARRW